MISSTWLVHSALKTEHDDVIKWKHFPSYWPFVRGIHRSPVDSHHKGHLMRSSNDFFGLRLNKRLRKRSTRRWFESPSRSLWRHCHEMVLMVSSNRNKNPPVALMLYVLFQDKMSLCSWRDCFRQPSIAAFAGRAGIVCHSTVRDGDKQLTHTTSRVRLFAGITQGSQELLQLKCTH